MKFNFSNQIKKSENYTLYSDFKKLKQILLTIVGNSIKYTNKGGVEVSLTTPYSEGDLKK